MGKNPAAIVKMEARRAARFSAVNVNKRFLQLSGNSVSRRNWRSEVMSRDGRGLIDSEIRISKEKRRPSLNQRGGRVVAAVTFKSFVQYSTIREPVAI